MNSKILGAIAAGILMGLSSARAEDSPDCHQTGSDVGLSRSVVGRLCRGTSGNGPVACYSRAHLTAGLTTDESIQLCHCAQSTRAADCVTQSLKQPHMGRRDALLFCDDPSKRTMAEQKCMGLDPPFG
jgi:hypothetical protein